MGCAWTWALQIPSPLPPHFFTFGAGVYGTHVHCPESPGAVCLHFALQSGSHKGPGRLGQERSRLPLSLGSCGGSGFAPWTKRTLLFFHSAPRPTVNPCKEALALLPGEGRSLLGGLNCVCRLDLIVGLRVCVWGERLWQGQPQACGACLAHVGLPAPSCCLPSQRDVMAQPVRLMASGALKTGGRPSVARSCPQESTGSCFPLPRALAPWRLALPTTCAFHGATSPQGGCRAMLCGL